MISFYRAESILRKALAQQQEEKTVLSVYGFPCEELASWLSCLLGNMDMDIRWESASKRPMQKEWESLLEDSSFCCLIPFLTSPCRGGHAAFFVKDVEAAGNGAILFHRLGIQGTFFSELGNGSWYMAAALSQSIHSEMIRPEQIALPAFGYGRENLDNATWAAISFGSFLLRAAGKAESLLAGADKARHVLYDRKQ